MIPEDGLPYGTMGSPFVTDSGFAGLPFDVGTIGVLTWVYLLLVIGWIGVVFLTYYSIKTTPPTPLRELDADHLTVILAWAGLLLLTGYTLRILHGP